MKLIVAFRNFVNAPQISVLQAGTVLPSVTTASTQHATRNTDCCAAFCNLIGQEVIRRYIWPDRAAVRIGKIISVLKLR
jgi:hypothetical protein